MAWARQTEKLRDKLLASEQGTLVKTGHCALEVGLLGLSPYEIITGSLGFQNAYRKFNLAEGARCERLFELAGNWISLEGGRPLSAFHVLASSISYEQEMIWLVSALNAAGVPLRTVERSDGDPVVFCGGPVITANPEPVAPFVDVCGIGDAESLIPRFTELWHGTLGSGGSRDEFLDELARLPGFYVPSRYDCRPGDPPSPSADDVPAQVPRVISPLNGEPVHSTVVSGLAHFRSMFMVEIARGCRWRCRFCMVCRINDPYRCADVDSVVSLLEDIPSSARSVGLVGANLCDHPGLGELLEIIARRGLRASVSSLRIGSLDREMLELLVRCGVSSITLAPETASPGLLKAIGKAYDPGRLVELVRWSAEAGFSGMKLYYMIGLPDETANDRELLASQLGELAAPAGSGLKLKASVNPFVPKPQTAWQDRSMVRQAEVKKIFRELKRRVGELAPGVELSWQSPAETAAQAVLSLGGRELAPALERSALDNVRLLDCLAGEGLARENYLHHREKPVSAHPWKVLECEPLLDRS
ncbi:MAG: radical SAM protein [Candidatus Glassbacteria bacterium]|nr:radical SAM protein [Candidatus Glassbacteria bacterium]